MKTLAGVVGGILLVIFIPFAWSGRYPFEPLYTASSFKEVIVWEMLFSLANFISYFLLLLILFSLIGLLYEKFNSQPFPVKIKKLSFYSVSVSLLVIIIQILISIMYWIPFEKSTHFIPERAFSRERVSQFIGTYKRYTVNFSVKESNLVFVKEEIIPNLEKSGYKVINFDIKIENYDYVPFDPINPENIKVKSISEVPFTTPLTDYNGASIGFAKDNSYLNILVYNFNESGQLTDRLVGSISADFY